MSTTTQTQSFTLATAVNLGSEWTMAEISSLETLKASKMSIKDMATTLGRSYYSVSTRLINLGLSKSHKARNSKPEAKAPTCYKCFTVMAKNGSCGCA